MAKTERARYAFSVKEVSDGTPFIMLEPLSGDIELLKNGFLAFDFPDGTDSKKAYKIAEYLEENIKSLAYASLP